VTGCGAMAFLRTGEPAAVPFRACCVAALLRTADLTELTDPAPVPCAAEEILVVEDLSPGRVA
jgi:hypothetical protein